MGFLIVMIQNKVWQECPNSVVWLFTVGFGVLIMTVTTAQVCFVIVFTINTLKMKSFFTSSTNHTVYEIN